MLKRFFFGVLVMLASGLHAPRFLPADVVPTTYFPLAVGNRWVYEAGEGSDSPGLVEAWEILRQDAPAFVMQIIIDGDERSRFEMFFVQTPESISRVATKEKENEEEMRSAIKSGAAQEVELRAVLQAPVTVGATWENADGYYKVTAVDKKVTVPAGTFTDCVEIWHQSRSGRVTVSTLYAPGVGVVMRDEVYPRLEGSGGFSTRQDRSVLQLKEWKITSPES